MVGIICGKDTQHHHFPVIKLLLHIIESLAISMQFLAQNYKVYMENGKY